MVSSSSSSTRASNRWPAKWPANNSTKCQEKVPQITRNTRRPRTEAEVAAAAANPNDQTTSRGNWEWWAILDNSHRWWIDVSSLPPHSLANHYDCGGNSEALSFSSYFFCFCQQSGANHAVCNEYERAVLLLRWKWAVSCCSVLCCECSWRPMRRTEFEKERICRCHFSRIQRHSLNSKQSFRFGYILFSAPCQLPACLPPAAVGNVLASLKQFFFFFPSPLNTHTPNSYTHARTLTHSKKQKTP